MGKVWLKGEYEFASLFSYRVPGFSTAFAPSSPLPGPSAVKLALVATKIEATGAVAEGERLFNAIRGMAVALEPPEWVAISRIFLRRLKRLKDGRIGQSFGIREYVHLGGPVGFFLEIAEDLAGELTEVMRRLRRIGTSDSLLRCVDVRLEPPDMALVARPLDDFATSPNPKILQKRPVLPLKDIKPNATFSQVNPFRKGGGEFTKTQFYIFPLRIEQRGDNWTLYFREAFQG